MWKLLNDFILYPEKFQQASLFCFHQRTDIETYKWHQKQVFQGCDLLKPKGYSDYRSQLLFLFDKICRLSPFKVS